MWNRICRHVLDAMERKLGEPVDYLRRISQISRPGFLKFLWFLPLAAHRRATPVELLFAARYVATHFEDCGSCAQMVVKQARQTGLPEALIFAIVQRDEDQLTDSLQLVINFTTAVLERTDRQQEYRDRICAMHGEVCMIELSLAIATARVFPTIKRAMGDASSCRMPPAFHHPLKDPVPHATEDTRPIRNTSHGA